MSLVRIAARIAAVEALKGRTLVGDNVLDSEIGALEVSADGKVRTDERLPFIAVYTDSGVATSVGLRSLLQNGPTDILFETGITAAMTELDDETGGTTLLGIGIPATDKAFEFYLDVLARQMGDALTDPKNEWGAVFLALSHKLTAVKRSRTSGDGNGQRLAGQQISVTADLWPDPVRGVPLAARHPLTKFFVMAERHPDLTQQIALMRSALAGTVTPEDMVRARYGRTGAEASVTNPLEIFGVSHATAM